MTWLRRLFRRADDSEPSEQHDVFIHIPYGGDGFPETAVIHLMYALEDELDAAVRSAGAGIIDGHEFGGGETVIFACGTNANALWKAMKPVLSGRRFDHGAFAVLRFGSLDGPEERIDLESLDHQE